MTDAAPARPAAAAAAKPAAAAAGGAGEVKSAPRGAPTPYPVPHGHAAGGGGAAAPAARPVVQWWYQPNPRAPATARLIRTALDPQLERHLELVNVGVDGIPVYTPATEKIMDGDDESYAGGSDGSDSDGSDGSGSDSDDMSDVRPAAAAAAAASRSDGGAAASDAAAAPTDEARAPSLGRVFMDADEHDPKAPSKRKHNGGRIRETRYSKNYAGVPRGSDLVIGSEEFNDNREQTKGWRPKYVNGKVVPTSTKGRKKPPEGEAGQRCATSHKRQGGKNQAAAHAYRNQGHVDAQKGHVFALQLGGPDVKQNIVPQWGQWQANGAWKKMENALLAAALRVRKGHSIYARIEVHYKAEADSTDATFPAMTFPTSFTVTAWELDAADEVVKGGYSYKNKLEAAQDHTDDMMAERAFRAAGDFDDEEEAEEDLSDIDEETSDVAPSPTKKLKRDPPDGDGGGAAAAAAADS